MRSSSSASSLLLEDGVVLVADTGDADGGTSCRRSTIRPMTSCDAPCSAERRGRLASSDTKSMAGDQPQHTSVPIEFSRCCCSFRRYLSLISATATRVQTQAEGLSVKIKREREREPVLGWQGAGALHADKRMLCAHAHKAARRRSRDYPGVERGRERQRGRGGEKRSGVEWGAEKATTKCRPHRCLRQRKKSKRGRVHSASAPCTTAGPSSVPRHEEKQGHRKQPARTVATYAEPATKRERERATPLPPS